MLVVAISSLKVGYCHRRTRGARARGVNDIKNSWVSLTPLGLSYFSREPLSFFPTAPPLHYCQSTEPDTFGKPIFLSRTRASDKIRPLLVAAFLALSRRVASILVSLAARLLHRRGAHSPNNVNHRPSRFLTVLKFSYARARIHIKREREIDKERSFCPLAHRLNYQRR